MISFNLRFCLLIVFLAYDLTPINAQFGGFLPSQSGGFSSQNTNFNQNRRGFGVIAGFGGSSNTNFNSQNTQAGES